MLRSPGRQHLVQDEDLGLPDDGARQGQPLPLAARQELIRDLRSARSIGTSPAFSVAAQALQGM
jgi:hypothetical protein